MRKKSKSTQSIQATISGDVSGQVAVGQNINQVSTKTTVAVTKAELKELRQVFKGLRAKIENESQPNKKDAALERVQELEQAISEKKPDLSTMEYVRNWFVKNLPGLAGAVTSFVVHPIVGRLVEAGGDELLEYPGIHRAETIFDAVYEVMHEVSPVEYPVIYSPQKHGSTKFL